MMRKLVAAGVALLCSGCSLSSAKTFDGPDMPRAQVGVLSSLGLYKDRGVTLMVQRIDNKTMDMTRTVEFLLLPGSHLVHLYSKASCRPEDGPGCAYRYAKVDLQLQAEAGHTYIPSAQVRGTRIWVYFVDEGLDFPRDCLPLQRWVNGDLGGLGTMGLAGIYSSGGKCALPTGTELNGVYATQTES